MIVIPKFISVNFSKGRTYKPLAIVIHTQVGSQGGTYNWFNNPAAQVSAHYNVGLDGSIWQHVSEGDRAWAQGSVVSPSAPLVKQMGSVNPNEYCISIETEDKGNPAGVVRTNAQYDAVGWLIAEISKRYGIPVDTVHIIDHREIRSTKTCPGNFDSYRAMAIANAYLNPPPPPTPPPPPPPTPTPTPVVKAYVKYDTPLNLITKQQTNLWNFNKSGWAFDSVKTFNAGEQFIAFGEAQHSNGGTYLMTEYSFGNADVDGSPNYPYGVNKADLIEPPVIVPEPPEPPVDPVPPEPEPVPPPDMETPSEPPSQANTFLGKVLEFLNSLVVMIWNAITRK